MMMVRRVRRRKTRVRPDLLPSVSNPRRNAITVEAGDISPNSASTRHSKAIILVVAVVVDPLAREEETKAMVVAEAAVVEEVPIPMPIWHATIATKKATLKETVLNSRTSRMGAPIRIMVLLHS
jgi:hypothetical protein